MWKSFQKYLRLADVGKSELRKNKIKKETCAKHKINRSQNGRSNNVNLWLLLYTVTFCAVRQ